MAAVLDLRAIRVALAERVASLDGMLAYSLATNRQIPSWLGKLNRRFRTPLVIGSALSIVVATVADLALLRVQRWLSPWRMKT